MVNQKMRYVSVSTMTLMDNVNTCLRCAVIVMPLTLLVTGTADRDFVVIAVILAKLQTVVLPDSNNYCTWMTLQNKSQVRDRDG